MELLLLIGRIINCIAYLGAILIVIVFINGAINNFIELNQKVKDLEKRVKTLEDEF